MIGRMANARYRSQTQAPMICAPVMTLEIMVASLLLLVVNRDV